MDNDRRSLDEAKATLIRCWGEMAPYWGISRTMAEVHALLFICPRPLCTDEIMAELSISRGNASHDPAQPAGLGPGPAGPPEGRSQGLLHLRRHASGTIFENIARQRKRREVEPIVDTICNCRETGPPGRGSSQDPAVTPGGPASTSVRLEEMVDFLHVLNRLFESFLQAGPTALRDLAVMMNSRTE